MAMTDDDMSEMHEMTIGDEPDPTSFAEVDAAIAGGEPALAEQFLQATEEFVETLQQITLAEGQDDADDFTRARNAIDNMRALACDVLRKYGFTPRRSEPDRESISAHEARHATIARKLGIEVKHASAGANPHVATRYQTHDLEKVIVTDLAGVIGDSSAAACALDENNAHARAMCLVRMNHAIAADAALPEALLAEAGRLVERARQRAADLVAGNMGAIARVAGALAKGGTLDGAAVDGLIDAK
jgi:hypothetical protein